MNLFQWQLPVLCSSLVLAVAGHAQTAAGPRTITFTEAVAKSLDASPRVKAAEDDLKAQIETKRGSFANLGPRVSAEYNDVTFNAKQAFNFGGQEIVLRDDHIKTGSVIVAQPITGLWALTEKARFDGVMADIKTHGLELAKAEASYGTAETYLRAGLAERLHEIARASITAAEGQLHDGQALERAGRINRGDRLRLDLALSEARAKAAQAKAAMDIAYAALREAMAIPHETQVKVELAVPLPPPEGSMTVDQAMATALTKRLDGEQARLGVSVAEFGKELAYTQFTPSVNVFWKRDRDFADTSKDDTTSVGIQLKWDLWNNGAGVFAVREAVAQTHRAEEQRRGLEQQIRMDVYQAHANLLAARESLLLADTAVSQAEEAYRLEKARFLNGSRSATDLVFAETAQAGAKGRLVSARTDVLLWFLRLQKASGGTQPTLL